MDPGELFGRVEFVLTVLSCEFFYLDKKILYYNVSSVVALLKDTGLVVETQAISQIILQLLSEWPAVMYESSS